MNTGQLPLYGFIVVVIIFLIRMPPEDVSKLVFQLLLYTKKGYTIGYILFIITLVGSIIYGKHLRRSFTLEIERVTNERNELQRRLTNIDFDSSDNQ